MIDVVTCSTLCRYTSSNKGTATSSSFCPFPASNSSLRFVICTCGIVTVFILFFNTPLSFVARQIFLVYALLFFAAFVLDCNAVAIGFNNCSGSFVNTNLHDDISSLGLTLTCQPNNYVALCIIDLIISAQFGFVHTVWLFCKDRYVRKTDTADQKSLLHAPPTPKPSAPRPNAESQK